MLILLIGLRIRNNINQYVNMYLIFRKQSPRIFIIRLCFFLMIRELIYPAVFTFFKLNAFKLFGA